MAESDTSLVPLNVDNHSLCVIQDKYETPLSDGAKQILKSIVSAAHAGLVSAAPMICQGPGNCPFSSRCPIYMADGDGGTYPINKQCIAEAAIIQQRFVAYMDEVNQDGKAFDSLTFRAQVSKLVELDLYDYRLSLILAGVVGCTPEDAQSLEGSLLIDQVVTVTKDGQEVHQIAEHPAWRMKVKINQQRMELLDSMGLTVRRKAAIDAALHRNTSDNFFSASAQLLERLESLEQAMTKG